MCEFLGKLKYEPKTQTFPVDGLKGIHVVGYASKDQYGNWSREWMVVSEVVDLFPTEYDRNQMEGFESEVAKVEASIEKLKAHGFDDLVESFTKGDLVEAAYWAANYENRMRDRASLNMRLFGFPTVLVGGLKSAKQAVYKAHNL